MKPEYRLILALDVKSENEANVLLNKLDDRIGSVKVNSLATMCPGIVQTIQDRGIDVWRDLKHHDIPGTVRDFIRTDVADGLAMTTVHSLGGLQMMQYAAEAAEGSDLKVLGITILTSHGPKNFNRETGISGSIQDNVIRLALAAEEAGLDGVVASAQEAKVLREQLAATTLIVTPGINPTWAPKRPDQSRVTTPREAILSGADHIVVGSAIHKSHDPAEAADKIVSEIELALNDRQY